MREDSNRMEMMNLSIREVYWDSNTSNTHFAEEMNNDQLVFDLYVNQRSNFDYSWFIVNKAADSFYTSKI